MTAAPPRFSSPDDAPRLRADLAAFTTAAAAEVLGPTASAALAREQRAAGLRAARAGSSPAAILTRLFMLGDTVTDAEADCAFPDLTPAGAASIGILIATGDGGWAAAVDLRPIEVGDGDVWLAADLGERVTGRAVAPGHVLGVGGASLTLAGVTPRAAVGRVLDLGTGCGIQSALLAGHAEAITATDISARALAFARFNAELAGHEWDLREGSLFEPVAGERFDLIVSNPPFVITPAAAHEAGLPVMEYREAVAGAAGESGVNEAAGGGDRLLAEILSALPQHLTSGGSAVLLANWEHHAGEDWRERVAALGPGLDLWVIQRELLDPAEYVEMWLRDGGLSAATDRERYEAVYAAWLEDFTRRGVEAVGFGYVLAAPTAGARSVRVEEATGPAAPPLGDHLAACFAVQRSLAAAGPAGTGAALADLRPVVAGDVTVEHHFIPGAEHPTEIVLRQGGGLGRTYRADTALAGLISAADGELTLGQISGALAVLLEEDELSLAGRLEAQVAELLATGLLTAAT